MEQNLSLLLYIAAAVASALEMVKQSLTAFSKLPDWLYRLIMAFLGAVLGIVGVLITPGALAFLNNTPLASNPLAGAVLIGLPLGVYGSRGVHLVFGLFQSLKNFTDAFALKTAVTDPNVSSVKIEKTVTATGSSADTIVNTEGTNAEAKG